MTVLLFVIIINVLLGLFVFVRNVRSKVNILFLSMVVNICLWSTSSFLTDNANGETLRLFFGKGAFVFPVLFTGCLVIFSLLFPVDQKFKRRQIIAPFILTMIGVVFSVSNFVVAGVKIRPDGTDILPGPMYNVYTLVVVGLFAMATRNYIRGIRQANAIQKMQAKFFGVGLTISFMWALLFNVLLPIVITSFVTAKFGPVGTVALVGFTAYAIVKHKLFDVRAVVARLVAYVLSLGTLAFIAYVVLFMSSSWLESLDIKQSVIRSFYVVATLFMAILYQPTKGFFDKLTNRLFYQDAYETQLVLDKVSSVIVGNIDPAKIQRGALEALNEVLRPTYMGFMFVRGEKDIVQRTTVGGHWSLNDPKAFQAEMQKSRNRILVIDELEDADSNIREILVSEDISAVVPLTTKDELIGYLVLGSKKSGNIYNSQDVGLLNITANELAVALQNAQRFEEIQAFNITLQEKVNEATRELKSTNRKLIELDEAKDEFISMASHQLRTPLTSIKGYLSMLLDGDMGKLGTNQTNALKEAFGSSQRMVFLISDFLNVSRIKTGKFVIEKSEVNLAIMVQEELTQLKELAESRSVIFQYDQPKEFPIVKLDDNKIRQVMMNMIDNAIYYTPVNGKVNVQLYVDDNEVVFKVIDNGIGVPKAERHKLFTKFFRAANARVARPDGTGLGLFMAQKVILAQGGTIIFESEEGKGSTFGWRFPLKKIKA